MKKSIFAAAVAALAAVSCTASAAGFRNEAESIYPIPSAFDRKYTSVEWSYIPENGDVTGAPLSAGGNVYFAVNNELFCKSESDGNSISSVMLPQQCSVFSGAVIGNTLIQPTKSGICTVNLQTMELIAQKDLGAEISEPCAADDNLAYVITESDNSETLRCIDLSDNLNTVWEYSSESVTALSAQGNRVVFGADTRLISADEKTGSYYETELGKQLTSAPFATEYAIYFSCTDGTVGRARLNTDGSFEEGTITYCDLEANDLTSPLAYNGSLYVCADSGLYVLDSLNMEQEQVFSEIKSGTSPWMCTGNGQQLYTVANYEDALVLYCININEELDEPIVNKLAKLENFSGGVVAPADSGVMFFRDGYGRVHALKAVGYDWFSIIIKLLLFIALIVAVFLWLRAWRKSKNPPTPRF
ncbi:MAG: hypothetical protein ACI4KM_11250 [Oscillospiraceae bacterium]